MIGGRVLDSSALVAFADGTSVYAAALVWTAVEEGFVLLVPSTAAASAWSLLDDAGREVLDVLLALPVTVVDTLDLPRARAVGARGGNPLDAHAVLCAADRGWAVVTGDPARYDRVHLGGVELEPLP